MDIKKILEKISKKFLARNIFVLSSREAKVLIHWKIVTGAFLTATVFLFISNFFIYREISKGEFFSNERPNFNADNLSIKQLDLVVKYFDEKRITYDYVRSSGVAVVDPSK